MKKWLLCAYLFSSVGICFAGGQPVAAPANPNAIVWKDKGVIKKNLTQADCRKPVPVIDGELSRLKEYRLFEVNSKAFWGYMWASAKKVARTTIPMPTGKLLVADLQPNSPTIAPGPGITTDLNRSFLIYNQKAGLFVNGYVAHIDPNVSSTHTIFMDVTEPEGVHYLVNIIPLAAGNGNLYAVYDSRNQLGCPIRPPIRG